MFRAFSNSRKAIISAEEIIKDRRLRSDRHSCPECHEKVIFRQIVGMRPHFAHVVANPICSLSVIDEGSPGWYSAKRSDYGTRTEVSMHSQNISDPIVAEQPTDDPNEQFAQGIKYFYGDGVEISYSDALRYFQMAARQQHAESQKFLAVMYMKGCGVEEDLQRSLFWWTLASGFIRNGTHSGCRLNENDMQAVHFMYYYLNQSDPEDDDFDSFCSDLFIEYGIRSFYDLCMDRNHDPDSRKLEPETLYELGCAYLDCIYIAPYPDWAASFFEEAASYGHHPSEFMLGEIYRTGVSHQYARSFEKAAEYYRLSAEGGYPPAQFYLALSHHRLGDAGYPEYRHWLGVACKNGEPHALIAEALDILSNSDEESIQNAFDLLHRAADSGQWYAFIELAD